MGACVSQVQTPVRKAEVRLAKNIEHVDHMHDRKADSQSTSDKGKPNATPCTAGSESYQMVRPEFSYLPQKDIGSMGGNKKGKKVNDIEHINMRSKVLTMNASSMPLITPSIKKCQENHMDTDIQMISHFGLKLTIPVLNNPNDSTLAARRKYSSQGAIRM